MKVFYYKMKVFYNFFFFFWNPPWWSHPEEFFGIFHPNLKASCFQGGVNTWNVESGINDSCFQVQWTRGMWNLENMFFSLNIFRRNGNITYGIWNIIPYSMEYGIHIFNWFLLWNHEAWWFEQKNYLCFKYIICFYFIGFLYCIQVLRDYPDFLLCDAYVCNSSVTF